MNPEENGRTDRQAGRIDWGTVIRSMLDLVIVYITGVDTIEANFALLVSFESLNFVHRFV